eukprot:Platyproteum_vivax@DN4865_c0_g1_i2.p1
MGSIDWPGLLQWSLKYADGTTESKVTKMTQEDRDFLEGAVREAMGSQVDHWSVAGDSIAKFRNLNDDVVITSLSVLERCVDDCPPIAGDIEKLGGIEPFVKIIQSREEPTILKAMQVYAPIFANNPLAQQAAGSRNAVGVLKKHIQNPISKAVQLAAVTCIGAIVRQEASLEKSFLQQGGLEILVQCAEQTDNPKLQLKSAGLISHFLLQDLVPPRMCLDARVVEATAKILLPPANSIDYEPNVPLTEQIATLAMHVVDLYRDNFQTPEWAFCKKELKKALEERLHFCKKVAERDSILETEIELLKTSLKKIN